MAKVRKERIDEGDDFSKMIFKTEKCFWEEYEKVAKTLNDEQDTKMGETISEFFKYCDKIYSGVEQILYAIHSNKLV